MRYTISFYVKEIKIYKTGKKMIRVYNDIFYKNKITKKKYEDDYIKKICSHAKNVDTKDDVNSSVVPLYDRINLSIKELYTLHNNKLLCLPKSFEDLLRLSPSDMATIYYQISVNYNPNIKNDINRLFFYTFLQKGKNKNKFVKKTVLLDYSFFYKDIASYILSESNMNLYSLNTCFYCNSAYINTYINNLRNPRHKFDIDHFIPKDKEKLCPLFSLSLYNFVPSCHFCNSGIKNSNVYFNNYSKYEILKLFPTDKYYNYDKELKFKILPDNFTFENNKNFYYADHVNDFIIELVPKGSNSNIYLRESNFFEIIQRYEYHKKEFLTYIDKRRKYTKSYFDLYEKNYTFKEANNLREAIFNIKLRKEISPIFYKIYNDIDNDIY